jgi:UDP-N-acetylmuramoyl-tripeptide--D-alanyl-D-alanine ligase
VALQPWARARAVPVGPEAAFGWEDEASLGLHGEAFVLRHPGGKVPVRLRLRGVHHMRNAALAGALAILAGFEPEAVAAGLGLAEPLPGRGRLHPLRDGGWLLDESYNAVTESILACARTLLSLEGGEAVAVLGCMRELGPAAENLHRQTGEGLRALGLGRVLVYGDYAGPIPTSKPCATTPRAWAPFPPGRGSWSRAACTGAPPGPWTGFWSGPGSRSHGPSACKKT